MLRDVQVAMKVATAEADRLCRSIFSSIFKAQSHEHANEAQKQVNNEP